MNSTEYYICDHPAGLQAGYEWQTLKSTNHPGEHDSNEHCSVHIHSNGYVYLKVDFLNLEADYDFVRVYDGSSDTAPSLANLTGAMFVDEIRSTGNHMFIVFTSDGNVNKDGFRLHFKSSESEPVTPIEGSDDLHCEQYDDMTCGGQTSWRCSYAQWRLDFYGNWLNNFKNRNNMFDHVNSMECVMPEEMVQCADPSMKVCRESAIRMCPVCYCADHRYSYATNNNMRSMWSRDQKIWSRMMKEASQHHDDSTCY